MNAFYEHHRDSIRFGYRCFDRSGCSGWVRSTSTSGRSSLRRRKTTRRCRLQSTGRNVVSLPCQPCPVR